MYLTCHPSKCQRIKLTVLIWNCRRFHVSDTDNHERDGNMMAVRTAVVHDKKGFATMAVFSQLTKEIADGKSYQFSNVMLVVIKRNVY